MVASSRSSKGSAEERKIKRRESQRKQKVASRANPTTRVVQKRLTAESAAKLLDQRVSRWNAATATAPARWLPQSCDQARYSQTVLAAAADSDGIARFDSNNVKGVSREYLNGIRRK